MSSQIIITDADLPNSALAYSTDSRLREKQEYYQYGDSGWTYKTPPVLADDVSQAMQRPYGPQGQKLSDKYRFIWLGAAVVRETEGDTRPIVRGDPNACEYQLRRIGSVMVPWLMPKKMFVRTRQPKRFFYVDGLGVQNDVTRPDLVPDSYLLQVEFMYVEFGDLEWRIERKYTGEELVTSRVFRKSEQVPSSQWRSIQTIRSKDGFYHEPCMAHVDGLIKREWEDRNLSKRELDVVTAHETAERQEIKAEEDRSRLIAERKESDAITDSHLDHAERRPASVNLGG